MRYETKKTQIHTNTNKSTHSEMGPVRQNPIQRTVRTAHLSVFMTVHSFSTQYNTEQFWHSPLLPPDKHRSSDAVYWLRESNMNAVYLHMECLRHCETRQRCVFLSLSLLRRFQQETERRFDRVFRRRRSVQTAGWGGRVHYYLHNNNSYYYYMYYYYYYYYYC